MATNDPNDIPIVGINTALNAMSFQNSSVLREALVRRVLSSLPNANCPSGFCDCNGGYCTCHGSVSTVFDRAEQVVSPATLDRLRQDRIAQLKAQLQELEGGNP